MRLVRRLITFIGVLTLISSVVPGALAATGAETTTRTPFSDPGPGVVVNETGAPGTDIYMVFHQAPSLARYQGGLAGLAPTATDATGAARLDTTSAASVAYLDYLAGVHDDLVAAMEAELGRDLDVRHRYDAVLNGVAVGMTADEAAQVSSLTGVRRVERDSVRHLQTDTGPRWIGAGAVWGTDGGPSDPPGTFPPCDGDCGEGIVVGIIDTGINTDHPSFADVGGDGYDHSNPRPFFLGLCDPILGTPFCNDKLIGVYDFTQTTPEDGIGHGSHTASTTAGNFVTAVMEGPTITVELDISGVAPHANIISYKACQELTGNCLLSGILASINAATLDMVDVINYSIGGGSSNPWVDSDAQAFFEAYSGGTFIATSAGNSGPGFGTMGSPADAPWVTSVGASTHPRQLANALVDMTGPGSPPADIAGKGITAGYGPARIVYAGDFGSALCGEGAADPATGDSATNPFPPGTFNGEIVVCDRGTYGRVAKGRNVLAGGAGGYVLANDAASGDSLVADAHVLPGVHITYNDGLVLKAWIAANGGAAHTGTGVINGMTPSADPADGDIMASFSSRGANPAVPSMIKPDVTAPGVDILAAYHTPLGTVGGPDEYNIISGTSMSSPHTAGAATLLRALYPDWSPDEVKSALMSVAFTTPPGTGEENHPVFKEDGATLADPFDMGAGRVDLRTSSVVGFVLDETPANHQGADPGAGGDVTTLNVPSLGNDECKTTCSWTRTLEGTAATPVTWTTSFTAPAGMTISVSPASFTLAPGATQEIVVTADVGGVSPKGVWTFAEVQFSNTTAGVPDAHFPVAVIPAGDIVTPAVTLYMHGNGHDDCADGPGFTGDGRADLVAGCDPFLSEDDVLDPDNPAARWGPAEPLLNGTGAQNIYDPNWIWNLAEPTTLNGPMIVTWWAAAPGANPVFTEDHNIRLFADGVLVVEERVSHNLELPNVPQRLSATVALSNVTADTNFVLQIDPVFIDSQQGELIYYDSEAGCTAAVSGLCDSQVAMPVVHEDFFPPVANDDAAFVIRSGTVVIDVLANDFDPEGGPLAVEIIGPPANGTAELTIGNAIQYTHDNSATTTDTIEYRITDNQGLTDTAFVNITIGSECLTPAPDFFDDFESGAPGWTVDTDVLVAGSQTWALFSPELSAQSPTTAWFTDALAQDGVSDTTKDVRLVSPSVTVSGSSQLTFWHRFDTEVGFDGGVLEISTDGTNWVDITAPVAFGGAGPFAFSQGGYNTKITSGTGFALSGRDAWTGQSPSNPVAMDQVIANLSPLAGQTIQVRFRFGQDQLLPQPGGGWWIDDVAFTDLFTVDCPVTEPPVAVDDSDSVAAGGTTSTDVKANDFDPDTPHADLTIEAIVTAPSSGTAVIVGDSVEYTHNGNAATSDFYEYRVEDPEGNFDIGRVDITIVRDPNPEPDAVDDFETVPRGGSITIDVKANDSDANHTNDELEVTIETTPASGAVGVNGDGTVTYTHNGDTATSDSFQYRLTDPEGAFDIATVHLIIQQDTGGTDKVTGGGYLLPTTGKKINFGFNAKEKADGTLHGHLTLNDKSDGVKIRLDTVLTLGAVQDACGEVAPATNSAEFTGTGTFNGAPASFRVCVADLGEPGNSGSGGADQFYLECTAGCGYASGDRTADDAIDGGNIQVHLAPAPSGAPEGGAAESSAPESAPEEEAPSSGTAESSSAGSSEASVLILDPLLLTESGLSAEVLTVRAYDADGELATGVSITLESVAADGTTSVAEGLTDASGVAVFTVVVVSGDVEHIARSGNLTSNAIDITGLL